MNETKHKYPSAYTEDELFSQLLQ